ncbi:hypothetical protein [Allosphingosinicella sp.]|jgi:hypothetical protein|uniref:hypothetical protein n=1 Tax=Allosphingosinicella sp. TaxID=2823234 RepID=UPI002EFCDFA5
MGAGSVLVAAALLFAGSGAGASERQVGEAFLRCGASHSFPLLTGPGPAPMLATRRNGRVEVAPWPADRGESILGSIEVNGDGTLGNMELRWTQQRGGWPESWRTDVHPLYLGASYQQPQPRPGGGNFDPAGLEMVIEVVSARQLRYPLLFRISRGFGWDTGLGLAAEPEIDYYRKRSAQVRARWSDIEAFADGEPFLGYRLIRPGPAPGAGRIFASGAFSLAIMPRLFEEFRTAEARLLEAAARAPQGCDPQIEPEPDTTETTAAPTGRR